MKEKKSNRVSPVLALLTAMAVMSGCGNSNLPDEPSVTPTDGGMTETSTETSVSRCREDKDCSEDGTFVCIVPRGQCAGKPPVCTEDEQCGENGRCIVETGLCVGPQGETGPPAMCTDDSQCGPQGMCSEDGQLCVGPPGPQGPAGPAGPQGPAGEDGASCSLTTFQQNNQFCIQAMCTNDTQPRQPTCFDIPRTCVPTTVTSSTGQECLEFDCIPGRDPVQYCAPPGTPGASCSVSQMNGCTYVQCGTDAPVQLDCEGRECELNTVTSTAPNNVTRQCLVEDCTENGMTLPRRELICNETAQTPMGPSRGGIDEPCDDVRSTNPSRDRRCNSSDLACQAVFLGDAIGTRHRCVLDTCPPGSRGCPCRGSSDPSRPQQPCNAGLICERQFSTYACHEPPRGNPFLVLNRNFMDLDEGTSDVVFATLTEAPSSTVTVTIISSNSSFASTMPETLQYGPGNWDVPQRVTVNAGQVSTFFQFVTISFYLQGQGRPTTLFVYVLNTTMTPDAGTMPPEDTGTMTPDAGMNPVDAGMNPMDAGTAQPDATPMGDGGVPPNPTGCAHRYGSGVEIYTAGTWLIGFNQRSDEQITQADATEVWMEQTHVVTATMTPYVVFYPRADGTAYRPLGTPNWPTVDAERLGQARQDGACITQCAELADAPRLNGTAGFNSAECPYNAPPRRPAQRPSITIVGRP